MLPAPYRQDISVCPPPPQVLVRAARQLLNRGGTASQVSRRSFSFGTQGLPSDPAAQVRSVISPACHSAPRAPFPATGRPPCPCPPLLEQSRLLQELNQTGQHEAVIQLFENGRLARPEGAIAEYVSALSRTNQLSNTALLQTLQVRAAQACARTSASGGTRSHCNWPEL